MVGKKIKVFDIVNIIIMLFIILITAYPVYYVVIASFSDPAQLLRETGLLWKPIEPFTLKAYRAVLDNESVFTGFRNTIFIMVVGVAINLILTALGAYFMSLDGPKLKTPITFMIIFTMYFSGGLIPSYLNVRDLKLMNTIWALILPGAINTTNLIIMKSAFQSLPHSLTESAQLDGATHPQILMKIMVPLSKATVAVLVLYYGVGHWNAWFNASIYLKDKNLYPLQLVMRNILNNSVADMTAGVSADDMSMYVNLIKYALIVVGTAPILVVYPFLQKYFVKGVMMGAIKG